MINSSLRLIGRRLLLTATCNSHTHNKCKPSLNFHPLSILNPSSKCSSVLFPSSTTSSYTLRTKTTLPSLLTLSTLSKKKPKKPKKPKVALIPRNETREIRRNFVKVAVHYQKIVARFNFSIGRTIESLEYDIKNHWKQLKEGGFEITDRKGNIWPSSSVLGDLPKQDRRVELFIKIREGNAIEQDENEGFEHRNQIPNFPKIPFINQIVTDFLKEDSIRRVIEQDYERPLEENDILLITNNFELWFYNQNKKKFSKEDSFEKIFSEVRTPFISFISVYSLQTLSYPIPSPSTPLPLTPSILPKINFAKPSLLNPQNWYPLARSMKRKIFCHIGPTNSGKTYAALERLMNADSGVYCGPLRLLAFEVYEKINAAKVPCSLLTGESQIKEENANHISCTIEMAETSIPVDVAVIDEYQLLGDESRGWAWTRALLGIPAKEVHLCGDPSSLNIVKVLCEMMGEEVEVKRYQRLSPLIPLRNALPSSPFANIEKGDCVIAFSRRNIYMIKQEIEKLGVHKCCVIYGALPHHSRKEQAALFNNPKSGFDVVVSSDAVGMGLNLNIKRVVFSTLQKFDGDRTRRLTSSEIKQIAGRAGRFGSIYPVGHVTCFERSDIPIIHQALKDPYIDLDQVGLAPTFEQLELFYLSDPKSSKNGLGYCMNRFSELAKLEELYFLCDHGEKVEICDFLDPIALSLKERYLFCISPVDFNNHLVRYYFYRYAYFYSTSPNEVPLLVDSLIPSSSSSRQLEKLESIHKILDLYLWLSYRFEKFLHREKAEQLKDHVHMQISKILMLLSLKKRSFKKQQREEQQQQRMENQTTR